MMKKKSAVTGHWSLVTGYWLLDVEFLRRRNIFIANGANNII
jgi:hypothetical protein